MRAQFNTSDCSAMDIFCKFSPVLKMYICSHNLSHWQPFVRVDYCMDSMETMLLSVVDDVVTAS